MKTCTGCKVEKPLDEFYLKNKEKGYRLAICKGCKSEQAALRWASGSEKVANYESKARRVQRAHDYIWELFQSSKCVDCGEANPVVFEFDHVADDKFADVAKMISSNYGLESIKKEIAKCEIVCANCHKVRTSERGNHWRHRRQEGVTP